MSAHLDNVVVKREVIGSTLVRGISSVYDSRSTKVDHVSGLDTVAPNLPGDEADLNQAIDAVLDLVGLQDPDDPEMTLRRVRAVKRGSNVAWIYRDYRRERRRFINPSFAIARHSSFHDPVRVYRSPVDLNGDIQFSTARLPNGQFLGADTISSTPGNPASYHSDTPPQPETHMVTGLRLLIPFFMPFDPLASIADHLGTTNISPVTYGPYTFAANTIKFEGAQSEINQDTTGFYYHGYFLFLATHGFVQQTLGKSTSGLWEVTEADRFPRSWDSSLI